MIRNLMLAAAAGALAAAAPAAARAPDKEPDTSNEEAANPLTSLKLRSIGPAFTGGRISDFAVSAAGAHDYFVATASGGLWRTTNAGTTWTPVFDNEGSFAIGDVEIAPSDPLTVWVGTGENNAQRSVAYGDGVYLSKDGGSSWTNVGLTDSGHIGKLWVHPTKPETALVAAQGPLWSDGGDRGLYRTTDGGETWERLLEIDEHTGVNEFLVHPKDRDRIVASSWQRRRHLWTLIDGGPGSGIHLTDDGGETWTEITAGLPKNDMGRIGLAMAPSDPETIYAIIEASDEEKGVYRSTDFGRTWEKRSDWMSTSPQYYNEIVVDPADPERLYALNTWTSVSEDGGKTFERLSNETRHVDDHALWIDPENTAHLIIGGDGGVYESWDRGGRWRHMGNLPIVQFYRIQPDDDAPFYNVCGGTQDNTSFCGPSRTNLKHGVTNSDWFVVIGGDGYKPQIDPTDPNIIYAQYQYGGLARFDKRSGERLYIAPKPPSGEADYKWNWNTPLLISPHDPQTIYYAAEKVFRSRNRGDDWEIISPDLTRQIDRNALEVMGRVWSVDAIAKNDSTSIWGSIIAFSESPKKAGLLYAGTDDGIISVSEDAGKSWRSVKTFKGVPDMSLVEDVIASVHDENVAYAVFDNHKRGDYKPYVYKTTDKGRTWKAIAGDLPERGSAHTIAEDHEDPDLLFVGTEFGLFVTQDGGKDWDRMKSGLPTIAVRDLEIQRRENDLVVGTFGRGIYILDDYSPLRENPAEIAKAEATLFEPRTALQYVENYKWGPYGNARANQGDGFYVADNPPYGAVFTYHLKDAVRSQRDARLEKEREIAKDGGDTPYPSWDDLRREDRENDPKILLTVRDGAGNVVRRIEGETGKGLHRVAWDLRREAPDPVGSGASGPLAAPGEYSVRLSKIIDGDETLLGEPQAFAVKPILTSPETTDDPSALLAFQVETSDVLRSAYAVGSTLSEASDRIEALKAALDRTTDLPAGARERLRRMEARWDGIAVGLYGDATVSGRNEPAPVGLMSRLGAIRGASWNARFDPAGVHVSSLEIARTEHAALKEETAALEKDLAAFEAAMAEAGAPYTEGRGLTRP